MMAHFRFREPGGRGRVGSIFESADDARRRACVAALGKPIDFGDPRLVGQLRRGPERAGGTIEETRP